MNQFGLSEIYVQKATFFVAFLFLCLLPLKSTGVQPTQVQESFFKGLWVIRHNMVSRSSIDSVLQFASDNGFRQVLLQTRGRGYAFYTSEVVPRSNLILEPEFDPLGYAVQKAHSLGLEVHAWLNMYILWSAPTNPENKNHLLLTNPEWTDADLLGVMDLDRDWQTYRNGLDGGIFLAPTHPEVNPYLLNVIQEVVNAYDIDGIHLDYIRYQGVLAGYNPTGREVFRNRYGVDPILFGEDFRDPMEGWDNRTYQIYIDTWNDYRRERVNELVKYANEICRSRDVKLSAAVRPDINNARSRYFQDWQEWLEDDLIDFVIPMNYAEDLDRFMKNLHLAEQEVSPERIAMGIAVYNQSKYDVSEKILKTLSAQFMGFCLFSYDSFKDNPTYIDVIRRFMILD